MSKVLFLSSMHLSKDDRIFYHLAQALAEDEQHVSIFSFLETLKETHANINICSEDIGKLNFKQQYKFCRELLQKNETSVIVCDSPLTAIIASAYRLKHKFKIVYDVTEWYPSKKNFPNPSTGFLFKILKSMLLIFINGIAGVSSNLLTFGEHYKSLPFRLFFWKKPNFIHYYPDLKYIKSKKPHLIQDEICLLYSGKFNVDKGINKVIEVAKLTASKAPNTRIILNLIGFYGSEEDKNLMNKMLVDTPDNLQVKILPYMEFEAFCEAISNNDIFLDLRQKDLENNHCLPIKIFYYLACGRPVIYSDLKSLKKEVLVENIGLFTDPNNTEEISEKICTYIKNQSLYESDCRNSLQASQEFYHWERERQIFLDAIHRLTNRTKRS